MTSLISSNLHHHSCFIVHLFYVASSSQCWAKPELPHFTHCFNQLLHKCKNQGHYLLMFELAVPHHPTIHLYRNKTKE